MAQNNHSSRTLRIGPGLPAPIALFWGYRDAAAGLPFRSDYESLPKIEQLNYENGRLMVLTAKADGKDVPNWFSASHKRGGHHADGKVETFQHGHAILPQDVYWAVVNGRKENWMFAQAQPHQPDLE